MQSTETELSASRPQRSPLKEGIRSLLVPWVTLAATALLLACLDDATIDNWFDFGDDEGRFLSADKGHKTLFPLATSDYVGFSCSIVGLIIASGGGIGGGGILVPTYIIIMKFSAKHAIALSNVTIFGGACANTLLYSMKRHPYADRPLIDWDLILVMEPLTIGGALVGAFLNKVLPEAILIILLVIVLSLTAWKTLGKGIKLYKKETQLYHESLRLEAEKAERAAQGIEEDEESEETLPEGDALLKNYGTLKNLEYKDELIALLEYERLTPRYNVGLLGLMFVIVLIINVLKGGGAFQSPIGIVCGGPGFWIANALMLLWSLAVMLWARHYLIGKWKLKTRIGYKYVEGDVEWDGRATLVYPALCSFAGFFAGMFGIGGGIVKGPLMLVMKVHPEVTSATSACMILFTAFTATTSFVVFGLLVYDYAAVCVVMGFVATFVGQVCLTMAMKKVGRYSYIIFSIGGVVGLSAILMFCQFVAAGGFTKKAMTPSGVCSVKPQ